ncbi:MAG: YVTN beta-propeller repeat-containing [Geobacteraceae bacterium]|nr:MAG: YVTN beta-propeller repeat-containing [Geobacteraceae bacterium]
MYLRLFLSIVCLLGCANFAHAAPFAYIANNADNTVSVIDTATNTVTATVTVDQKPYGVAVNPSGGRVYVSNQTGKSISVIDTATNAVAKMTLAYTPGGLAVNPAGTRLYVANNDNMSISVIDINPASANYLTVLNTATVGQNSPDGVAMRPYTPGMGASAADNRVYVTSFGSNKVSVFNTALLETSPSTAKIIDITVGNPALPTDITAPKGIAVTPDGTKVYVANLRSNNVSVISTSSNTVTATINTSAAGTEPYGVAINPAGTKAYVSNSATGYSVSVIDIASDTVTGKADLTVGASPYGIAVTPSGSRVLTANALYNNVLVIDATTTPPTQTTTVAVGGTPYSLGNFIGPELIPITVTPGTGGNIVPADGTITVNGGTIQAAKGRDLTVNIIPAHPSNFVTQSVTVDTNPPENPVPSSYTFTNITTPHTISATFNRVSYTVTISKQNTGTGTVTSTPAGINCTTSSCSTSFPVNTALTLVAQADAGSAFLGWSGGGCEPDGTGTLDPYSGAYTLCKATLNGINTDFLTGEYEMKANFYKLPVTTLQGAYNGAGAAPIACTATYNEDFDANLAKTVTLDSASPNTTLTIKTAGVPFKVSAGTLILSKNTFIIK